MAGGVALAPYAPLALSYGRAGLTLAGATTRSAFVGLGYSGSGATIAGSVALKGTVGVGFEYVGNSIAGEQMTWGKGIGAASAAIVFGPGAEKFLGINPTTPWGLKAVGQFAVSGGAAGFGGNATQQGVDYVTLPNATLNGRDLVISTAWGAGFGPLAGGVQRIYTPSFIKTTGNSLIEDVFGAPKTITEGLGTISQKRLSYPKPAR